MRVDEGSVALVAVQSANTAARPVRIGNEGDQNRRIRADATWWNHIQPAVIYELLAGEGVINRDHCPRGAIHEVSEVASLFKSRGHGIGGGAFAVLLVPFLAVVTPGSITPVVDLRNRNRSAYCKAIVVLVVRGRSI